MHGFQDTARAASQNHITSNAVREMFANYFIGDGKVSWQDSKIH